MKVKIPIYILAYDSICEGDGSHNITLFGSPAEGQKAFEESVKLALDDFAEPPVDISEMDSSDAFDQYEGEYVMEKFQSGTPEDPQYCVSIYKMGYADEDHIDIRLAMKKVEIENSKNGLTKPSNHNKI